MGTVDRIVISKNYNDFDLVVLQGNLYEVVIASSHNEATLEKMLSQIMKKMEVCAKAHRVAVLHNTGTEFDYYQF